MKFPNIGIKSPLFIYSFLFCVVISSAVIFVPNSSWKKIFSGRFNMFATVFSSTPNSASYVANGIVDAIISDNSGGVYIGGAFTAVGPNTGTGAPIAVSTGLIVSTFPKVLGTMNVVISDGSGGWFIGGDFSKVGTTTINRIAHILSNGTVDPDFHPTTSSGGTVLALVISGNTLYVGGAFTTFGGLARNRIAAYDLITNTTITTFNPDSNNTIRALAISGNTLYAGGVFTTFGGLTRNRIVAYDLVNSTTTSFNPNSGGTVLALALSSTTLYAGGSFTTFGGLTRNSIAAYDLVNSTTTSFNPGTNGAVNSLALSSTTLYAGGSFTTFGGLTRNRIVAYDIVNATTTSLNPNAGNTVNTLILSPDGNTIYLGGSFTTFGGLTRNSIAAYDIVNATTTSFNPNADNTVNSIALSADGNILYAGGFFISINASTRNCIAHILSNGTVDPSFNPNSGGTVLALALSSTTLYAGGSFTTFGGLTRNRTAAYDLVNSTTTSLNPGAESGAVNALALSSTTLYYGGTFTSIAGGLTRNRIAAYNLITNTNDTSFNPGAGSTVNSLAISSTTLYVGGGFTTFGGLTRNRIAAYDIVNSTTTNFDPNAGNTVNTLILSPDGNTLYLGGSFTTIGGLTRNRIAAYDIVNSTTTSFNPNAGAAVLTLAISGTTTLYAGGSFTTFGGLTRNYIAAYDLLTNTTNTTFNPNASFTVNAIAPTSDENTLYIGGNFATLGGNSQPFFASFPIFVNLSAVTMSSNNSSTTLAKAGDIITIFATSSSAIGTPTVTIDGRPASVSIISNTTFSASITATITDATGTVPFTIDFSDLSGNPGTTVTSVTSGVKVTLDTTAPTVSITAPIDNSTISGLSVTISANSSDNIFLSGVQFKLDTNTNIGAEDILSPYTVTWDSTGVSDGAHTIIAVARDVAGNYATSTVINIIVDNTAPVSSNDSPSGTLPINTTTSTISLSTNESATCKYSTTPGTDYGSMTSFSTTGGTSHSSLITGLTNGGSYIYYVKCQDGQGNTNNTDFTISFNIQADITAPVVEVTAPDNNTFISGSSVAVTASSTDDVSVSGVLFKIDNIDIDVEDTSFPYGVTLDTTPLTDGAHEIIAVARDGTGNQATSSVVTVTVDNTSPIVSAGSDKTKNALFEQDASSSDATSGIASWLWSTVSGPGTITFSTTTERDTSISADTDGTYVLKLTVTDNAGNSASSTFILLWDTIAPSIPTASPAAGAYAIAQNITLSSIDFTSIRFTEDGSDPASCSGGNIYIDAIPVTSSETINARGCDDAGNASLLGRFNYTIATGRRRRAPTSTGSEGAGKNVVATTTHTLTYLAGNNGSIAAFPIQIVDYGDAGALVTAVPDSGYYFIDWSDGATSSLRIDLNVINDLTVIANFAANPVNASTTASAPLVLIDVFTGNLKYGDTSAYVKLLQQFLNAQGYLLTGGSYGSTGKETNYFGPLTKNAVIRFQEANAKSILTPLNLIIGTGNFFEHSRFRANQILNQ